jgi:hypothetical protein
MPLVGIWSPRSSKFFSQSELPGWLRWRRRAPFENKPCYTIGGCSWILRRGRVHVSDIAEEPIVPQPKKARAARRRKKKRRDTPRPNLDAINARRREAAAARRALLTATSNRENPAHPTIEEFVTGRQYLRLSPTPYQLTLQKAMYGLTLTDQELDIWRECTGGREYSSRPFSELTCIAGARSGKNSYIETPILLYEALYGGFSPNRGEICAVVLVAQDARAATISLELAREYLKQSPVLSKFLVRATKDALFLSNGIRFMVFPCTSRSLYGFSIVGAAMDEVGRFRFEGAADTDVDVQHAILRGMVKLYNKPAKLIKISSPSSRAGLLYSDFQRSFGKPDEHRLVWRSTSEKMANGIVDSALIQRIREEDPSRAARIYDAEFCEDVDVFLSAEVIEAVTDHGIFERLPENGVKYIAACDPAGHGNDAFTLSIVKVEGTKADLRIEQVFSKAWVKPRSGLRNLEVCVAEANNILMRYQLKTIYGDRGMTGWVFEAFQRHGVTYDYPFIKRSGEKSYVTRSEAYQESAPLFRANRVRILDDETTRRELRNLELRGDRVTPGPGHDDRANALCLAICMAFHSAIKPAAFASVTSITTSPLSWVRRAGAGQDGNHLVRTPRGQLEEYRDPRGL